MVRTAGTVSASSYHQLAVDGPSAVLAQIARLLQLATQDQHEHPLPGIQFDESVQE